MAVPPVRDIRVYNVNVLIHQTKITKESTDSNDKKNLAEKRHSSTFNNTNANY